MEFLTEEVIAEIGISKEQVEKIKPLYDNDLANKLKERDTLANGNAEKIIQGAIDTTLTKFGVTDFPRQAGEKNADYLARLNEKVVESSKSNIAKLETELKEKIKNSDGSTLAKEEVDKLKTELDDAKKKLANYDDLVDKASKYESTAEALSGMKLSVAYNSVKPNFPAETNQFEVKAKWDEFIKATNEKWLIEIVENEPIAIDNDNEHKRVKLSELVSQNKEITELLQGRQQRGSGANPAKTKVDGLPFEIDGEPTTANISKAINAYLDTQNVPIVSNERGTKFQELFDKAKELLKK